MFQVLRVQHLSPNHQKVRLHVLLSLTSPAEDLQPSTEYGYTAFIDKPTFQEAGYSIGMTIEYRSAIGVEVTHNSYGKSTPVDCTTCLTVELAPANNATAGNQHLQRPDDRASVGY
jgi:hypothetical protein